MNRKEIEEQTQEVVKEKYSMFEKGKITEKEWAGYMCDLLENYIKKMIKYKHRTLGASFEDLMQQGYMAIVENLPRYDPERSTPTTYFTPYIDQYLREALDNPTMTTYYIGAASKLEKAAKERGYEGFMDPRLDDMTLSVISGVPLQTVINTREEKNRLVVSLEQVSENIATPHGMALPEKVVIEREQAELINERLKALDPLDLYILVSYEVEGMTLNQIQQSLGSKWARDRFKNLPEKPGQVFIEQRLNQSKRSIRHSNKIRNYFNVSGESPIEVVEQASEADISSAFAAGELFDL